MLPPSALVLVGMWDESAPVCRPCAVKRYGILYIELLEDGRRTPQQDMVIKWGHGVMASWDADEAARDRGCEEATEYHADCESNGPGARGGCEAVDRGDGEWFCERCAALHCEDCGKRLDWSEGDSQALELSYAERGLEVPPWA